MDYARAVRRAIRGEKLTRGATVVVMRKNDRTNRRAALQKVAANGTRSAFTPADADRQAGDWKAAKR